jgi:hypothetical protein
MPLSDAEKAAVVRRGVVEAVDKEVKEGGGVRDGKGVRVDVKEAVAVSVIDKESVDEGEEEDVAMEVGVIDSAEREGVGVKDNGRSKQSALLVTGEHEEGIPVWM